ncbi:MAG: glycosyltransferase family 4 protein [Chloroflexi bacterium]|jgi:glycosyltransferase involved in cell wall biosynthesis|nr:glycosyltransferase family 4 protein [Chloroflexota bacterium]MBT3670109.1 glycosyltransferase family 4 protein [Chloroflexota bacterium]MBT4001725.1 glycosyltransferase family 4 protein [Chloroflexota bacterium]MBT4306689.1 glycosyltransferase family 4 protein [Chloroflexota bacterium]MBT4532995.1 glycosyltransferase family 4 protein [Chloroflexota bacterium]
MKILIVALSRHGAMVHYSIAHTNSLSAFAEVSVVTSKDVALGSFDPKIKHYQIETGKKKVGTLLNAFNPRVYKELVAIAKECGAEIAHLTVSHEWNPMVAWVLKKYLKLPLVYTVFDPTPHEGTPLYFLIPEVLVRLIPDAYIVQTDWLKEDFLSKGYAADKTYVIQQGSYSAITQWRDKEIPKENMILFFGRIDLHKGIETLLQAAPQVLEELPDWRIVIAGKGKFEPYRKLDGHERIEVINRYIEDEEGAVFFQKAKMVVLPYNSATSTGVVGVAYEFENPVVATDVGSLGAVVEDEHTGLMVPARNPALLAEAILRLAKDEAYRKQLGKNALAYSKESLNWDSFAKAHLEVYQEVIEKIKK